MSMARIVADGEEAAAVAPLPVAALGADDAIIRGLSRAGLKTIGDVASRARHEITARFGARFTSLLEQALGAGRCADLPAKTAAGLHRRESLCRTGRDRDVIALTLSTLAAVLVAAMDRHGKGARLLEASFFRTDGAVRAIAVETGQPITRAAMVERLFREKLDALADPLDPGFGFDLIRLSASRTDRGAAAARSRRQRARQ